MYCSIAGSAGAWVGERNKNKNPGQEAWIQVDLGQTFKVTAVQTQGRNGISQWIKKFTLTYSSNETDWTSYKGIHGKDEVF